MSHNKTVIGQRKKPFAEAALKLRKKLFSFWINASSSGEIIHRKWIQSNGYPAQETSYIFDWYYNGGMAKDKIPFWAMRGTFKDILKHKKKFWDRAKTLCRYELDLLTFKLKTFYSELKGDQYGIIGCTRRYHTLKNYFSGKYLGEYTDECFDWETDKTLTDEEFENWRYND